MLNNYRQTQRALAPRVPLPYRPCDDTQNGINRKIAWMIKMIDIDEGNMINYIRK